MSSAPPHGNTAALTRFGASCRLEDIPKQVRHEAKRSLVNCFAVALAPRSGADAFAQQVRDEFDRWGVLVKQAGVKAP